MRFVRSSGLFSVLTVSVEDRKYGVLVCTALGTVRITFWIDFSKIKLSSADMNRITVSVQQHSVHIPIQQIHCLLSKCYSNRNLLADCVLSQARVNFMLLKAKSAVLRLTEKPFN